MARRETKAGKDIELSYPMRVLSPSDEMGRWIENVLLHGWTRPFRMEWPAWSGVAALLKARIPKVGVIDTDDELVVRAERRKRRPGCIRFRQYGGDRRADEVQTKNGVKRQ